MNLNFFKHIAFYRHNLIGTELLSSYEINYFINLLNKLNVSLSYNILDFDIYKNNLIINYNKKPLNFCLDKFLADYKNFDFLFVKNIHINNLNDAVLFNSIIDFFLNSNNVIFIPCLEGLNASILNVYDTLAANSSFSQSNYIDLFKLRLKLLCMTRLATTNEIYPQSIKKFLDLALQHNFYPKKVPEQNSEDLILDYSNNFQIIIKLNFLDKFNFNKFAYAKNNNFIQLTVYSNFYEIYFNSSSLIYKILSYIAYIQNNSNSKSSINIKSVLELNRKEYSSYLKTDLSKIQKTAVKEIDNPVIIIAGAGSGKTNVIVNKFLHLSIYISPYEILILTFTNNAAGEIKDRILKAFNLNDNTSIIKNNLKIYTYHSFFYSIIKIYYRYLGFQNLPKIYAENNCKNNACNSKIDGIYNFDDILQYVLKLFKNESILIEIAKMYKYILVDEYQDINLLSDIIIKKIDYGRGNITYAGDDDQSIYRFNGGDSINLLSFDLFYPSGKAVLLQSNYRCNESIINFSNNIIQKIDFRYPKSMILGNNINNFKNESNEKNTYSLKLKDTLLVLLNKYACDSYVFNYNTNNWISSDKYFNKIEELSDSIKLNAVNLIHFKNYSDETAFNINLFILLLTSGIKAAILTRTAKEEIEYKTLFSYYAGLPQYNNFKLKYYRNAFIGTIHKSKGMEFSFVILGSLSAANFPKVYKENNDIKAVHPFNAFYNTPFINYKNTIDDERRLFYVGTTRAKDFIFITYTGDKSSFIDF
ncbi:MAG: ATP-dependent helicase [Candidatus Acididesulfobacter guangdongensis]|uniref:DNA 3'-5' helicase n=1 Tax=Acididesulfobacter guangdongensis TaxID=2597225 RepID=A0A519BI65_ACIG2|nr:MAG: ATP-dependent helicase [Candidatus Acididesulfobacter guangdongensis]